MKLNIYKYFFSFTVASLIFIFIPSVTYADANSSIKYFFGVTSQNTINNYEPRVKLLRTQVSPNYETLEFDVVITYEIIGVEAQPQQLSFALEPAR